MMLGITGSAQLTIVKDVSATGLRPTDNEHFIWQNNRWNGKHYYGVTVTPSVAIAVTDGTDAGTKAYPSPLTNMKQQTAPSVVMKCTFTDIQAVMAEKYGKRTALLLVPQ